MSEWKEKKLSEVIDIYDSRRIPLSSLQRETMQGIYPYYGASGIIDYLDKYIFDGEYLLIAEDGENLNSRKLPIAFWAKGKFWVNNHAHIILGKKGKANTEYIRFCFASSDISGFITGTAQPKLSQANLKKIKFKFPPLPVQKKIAAVLSAYDDLIENNKRRIALLEKMAEEIYREWFVRMRFPGYKETKFEKGVPVGWEIQTIGDICLKVTDGSHSSPEFFQDGKFMASVKDMTSNGFDLSSVKTISETNFEKLVKSDCKPKQNDILIAKDGSYLKHVFVWNHDYEIVILSSIAILRPNLEKVFPFYLALLLKQDSTKTMMSGYVSGSALPRIILNDFKKMKLLIPTFDLMEKFEAIVKPIFDNIILLNTQNEKLEQSRNMLLSRLISRKLSVENLDIQFPPSMREVEEKEEMKAEVRQA